MTALELLTVGRVSVDLYADDGDASAADRERFLRRSRHLNFNVVRLRSAKITPTITNRAITFGSLQPISSK